MKAQISEEMGSYKGVVSIDGELGGRWFAGMRKRRRRGERTTGLFICKPAPKRGERLQARLCNLTHCSKGNGGDQGNGNRKSQGEVRLGVLTTWSLWYVWSAVSINSASPRYCAMGLGASTCSQAGVSLGLRSPSHRPGSWRQQSTRIAHARKAAMSVPPAPASCDGATYRCSELGGLSRLSTLLADGGERRAQGGNVVGGESAVQLPAGIVGRGTHLGSDGTQWTCEGREGRLFAGRLEAVALSHAGREGHFARNTLRKTRSARTFFAAVGVGWAVGGEDGSRKGATAGACKPLGGVLLARGEYTHSKWYTGGRPWGSGCAVVRTEKRLLVVRGRLLVSSVGSAVVALGRGRRWSECERWGGGRRGFSGYRATVANAKRQTQRKLDGQPTSARWG
jgi:hypothetical protein